MSEKQEVKQAPVITPEVIELIKGIVTEARKPVKTEKELREEAATKAEQESMRAIEKQRQANKAADQNACQHEHESGVGTPVVYVASLNRLYCQHCQLWIFSTPQEAAQNGSNVAFENHPKLWNRYFAKAYASGMA
jgi:hypothetical protein